VFDHWSTVFSLNWHSCLLFVCLSVFFRIGFQIVLRRVSYAPGRQVEIVDRELVVRFSVAFSGLVDRAHVEALLVVDILRIIHGAVHHVVLLFGGDFLLFWRAEEDVVELSAWLLSRRNF